MLVREQFREEVLIKDERIEILLIKDQLIEMLLIILLTQLSLSNISALPKSLKSKPGTVQTLPGEFSVLEIYSTCAYQNNSALKCVGLYRNVSLRILMCCSSHLSQSD